MRDEYQGKNIAGALMGGVGAGLYQTVGQCAEARQSAKSLLRDRIARLRREADRLEALAGALPESLPMEADSGLYDLLTKRV